VYYYRRVENAEYGVKNPTISSANWDAWERVSAQIPVRNVSPVVHQGQLYVFWTRYTTSTLRKLKDGGSFFVGYQHRDYVEFTPSAFKRLVSSPTGTPVVIEIEDVHFPAFLNGITLVAGPAISAAAKIIRWRGSEDRNGAPPGGTTAERPGFCANLSLFIVDPSIATDDRPTKNTAF